MSPPTSKGIAHLLWENPSGGRYRLSDTRQEACPAVWSGFLGATDWAPETIGPPGTLGGPTFCVNCNQMSQ